MRGRAAAMLMASLAAVLTGCGVRPTGVVDAGEPATGLQSGVQVYFVWGNGLRPVVLPARGEDDGYVLQLLFDGPDADARAAGLRTAIPAGTQLVPAAVLADNREAMIGVFGSDPARLSRLARAQIACTAIAGLAQRGEHVETVTIASKAGRSGPTRQRALSGPDPGPLRRPSLGLRLGLDIERGGVLLDEAQERLAFCTQLRHGARR
jgi:hypothetical protein